MKARAVYYGVIVCLICNSAYAAVKLMDPEMYIQKIAKRVVEILEVRYITGPDMTIDDYTAPIELSSYGIVLRGNVSFHSGFVSKIAAMELNMQRFAQTQLDTETRVEAAMLWRNVSIAMDIKADVEGYQGPGTLLVTYGQFELPLTTKRLFATGELSGTLTVSSISSQNDMTIIAHPNNAHVQMIARAVNINYDFRNYMIQSVQRWNLLNILNVAMSEIPYPEMCYNC